MVFWKENVCAQGGGGDLQHPTSKNRAALWVKGKWLDSIITHLKKEAKKGHVKIGVSVKLNV